MGIADLPPTKVLDSRKGPDALAEIDNAITSDTMVVAVFGTMAPDDGEPVVVMVTGERFWLILSIPAARRMLDRYYAANIGEEGRLIMEGVQRIVHTLATNIHNTPETLQ